MPSVPLPDASDEAVPAPAPDTAPQTGAASQLHIRSAQLAVDRWLREVASS